MDYKSLNFKCGLEIHQQLNLNKLFCNCQSSLNENKLSIEFERKIRSSAGETGKVDIASKFEHEKNKSFIYQGYEKEYCLVDMDEEPPHKINQEALKVALTLAKLLKLEIPKILYVMRKTVSDGSACSGFQRTVLIGLESENSYLETKEGKVKITNLFLEEDACKIKKKEENKVYYSLSRLGIPLIELNTDASIKSPEQAKEIASMIGLILRSFPEVRKGIGTIRQDVNLSIRNQQRVEIKGFQDIRSMPQIINNEVQRQLDLLKKNKNILAEVRKAEPDGSTSFLRPMPGSSRLYPETDIPKIIITDELLNSLVIPELLTEKTINLEKKYNLSQETAREILSKNIDFEDFLVIKDTKLVADILITIPKDIKTRNNIEINLEDEDFKEIIKHSESLSKEAIQEIMIKKNNKERVDYSKYKTPDNLEEEIKKIIKANPGAPFNALMGEVMKVFKGKVDGKTISQLIKKYS